MSQRRFERTDTLNFLDIEHVAREGEVLNQGMGRTLDVSEVGLKLETHIPLQPGELLRVAIGLNDDVMEMQGRIVRVTEVGTDTYHAGVEFINLDANGMRVLKNYLEAFNAAKS